MARGMNKSPKQAEKLLMVLLDGQEVTMIAIESMLGTQFEFYRLSTYLWNLKTAGADIRRNKVGRKVVSLQLLNHEVMATYAGARGLIAPPALVLTPEDLMVAAG